VASAAWGGGRLVRMAHEPGGAERCGRLGIPSPSPSLPPPAGGRVRLRRDCAGTERPGGCACISPATMRPGSRPRSWRRSAGPTRALRSATARTRSPSGSRARLRGPSSAQAPAFLGPTGTAANALSLAQIAPPWGAVLCHEECHLAVDECGAPEFFGGGLKLIPLPGEGCKISVAAFEAALERLPRGGPHHV